ncbi:hypothetical protein [Beijerinckia sp. L45]|uniref:hypothetical protein n=1 Tax=Beijerinckia sp. L45 TaxID=1641855 RepID=UPI00131BC31D|nr:hypothetical protein [Beijerinckia sp. L45]
MANTPRAMPKNSNAPHHFEAAALLTRAQDLDAQSALMRDHASDLLSKSVQMSKSADDLRARAASFSVAAKVRDKKDINTWFIAVADRKIIGWSTKLSQVRPGAADVPLTLCLECNRYPQFAADHLGLQKADVAKATTVGAFLEAIYQWYRDHEWHVS